MPISRFLERLGPSPRCSGPNRRNGGRSRRPRPGGNESSSRSRGESFAGGRSDPRAAPLDRRAVGDPRARTSRQRSMPGRPPLRAPERCERRGGPRESARRCRRCWIGSTAGSRRAPSEAPAERRRLPDRQPCGCCWPTGPSAVPRDRPCAELARRLFPDYPGPIPLRLPDGGSPRAERSDSRRESGLLVQRAVAALGRGEAPALGGDRAALDAVRRRDVEIHLSAPFASWSSGIS